MALLGIYFIALSLFLRQSRRLLLFYGTRSSENEAVLGIPEVSRCGRRQGIIRKGTLNSRERAHIVVSEAHRVTVVEKWEKKAAAEEMTPFVTPSCANKGTGQRGEAQPRLPVTHLLWQGLNLLTFSS